jgi:hypothetical protein
MVVNRMTLNAIDITAIRVVRMTLKDYERLYACMVYIVTYGSKYHVSK